MSSHDTPMKASSGRILVIDDEEDIRESLETLLSLEGGYDVHLAVNGTDDGNGNISEYLATNGTITAHFEYDPFGNTVVNTDTSNQFSYRFSTKPRDVETGLYYYGYRYYDPLRGRWPSRDPIEEEGGVNLYGFVGNDGINRFDVNGLCEKGVTSDFKPKVNAFVPGRAKAPNLLLEAAKTATSAWNKTQTVEAAFAALGGSMGLIFKVEVSLDYKCCICKSGSNTSVEQPTLGPSNVDNPNLGDWGTRPDAVAGIGKEIKDAIDALKDEAKTNCENLNK